MAMAKAMAVGMDMLIPAAGDVEMPVRPPASGPVASWRILISIRLSLLLPLFLNLPKRKKPRGRISVRGWGIGNFPWGKGPIHC